MNSRLRVVDTDTGEISVDHYARHRKQDEAYAKQKHGRRAEFTFTDMENITQVIEAIDDKHCGYLLYLQCFIAYDGLLVNAVRDKTPMTKRDIQRTVSLGKSAFYEFYGAMVANGIITEKDGGFYVNPAYHFRGSTSNQHVIKTFSTKVKSLYNGRNAKQLGFVYKLLPFIHLETNTVCNNPYERDVAKICEMSTKGIVEITGVSEKTVYNYLRKMKLGEEFVFAEIRRGKTKYYKLNPFIFYRKSGAPDATLREIFRLGFGS